MKNIVFMVAVVFATLNLSAKIIKIDTKDDDNLTSLKSHDVKFVVESSLSSANWDPGTSRIVGTNQDLLDYDTEGLKLYRVTGKMNIFDTDVLTIEKYGTFESGSKQKDLLKLRKNNNDSALEGVNFSVRAFLLLKYFYLYEYDFLDDIEYQYDYFDFYSKVVNNLDAIYWWGKKDSGHIDDDYVYIPKGSSMELTTEFKERRLYLIDLKSYLKRFFIDSFKIGYFSTDWIKESFIGVTARGSGMPVIQSVLLESKGISLQATHTIEKLHIDLKLRYNYGFENYVTISHNSYDSDYSSIDLLAYYRYDIYKTDKYLIFTKLNAVYSAKWFDAKDYTLNTDSIYSAGVSLGVVF